VSELAQLEVELHEESNPAIVESHVVEATLYLKGVTLRARAGSTDMGHAIHCCEEQLFKQVKRHRAQRRGRRETRAAQAALGGIQAQL
jgi:ribosomal subunit interface protein